MSECRSNIFRDKVVLPGLFQCRSVKVLCAILLSEPESDDPGVDSKAMLRQLEILEVLYMYIHTYINAASKEAINGDVISTASVDAASASGGARAPSVCRCRLETTARSLNAL